MDPTALGLRELSRAYATGMLDPVQVWQAYAQRMQAHAARLGCVFKRTDSQALAQAHASQLRWRAGRPLSALDGVPIGVKDNIAVAGWPCSAGTQALRDAVCERDAAVWQALAHAGAVMAGKLALDEGALGALTRNPHFGDCANPLDASLTPGGSSGGSACAVAARLCAAALGTDTLGSVRIPAAYCGLFGLKPSTGVLPLQGVVPLSPDLDVVGLLARSGEDLVALASVMPGLVPGLRPGLSPTAASALSPTAPHPPSADAGPWPWASLRVGLPEGLQAPVLQPAVLASLQQVCERLQGLGAQLKPVTLPGWEPGPARRDGLLICEADGHAYWSRTLGPSLPGLSAEFAKMLRFPQSLPPERLIRARDTLQRLRSQAHTVFEQVDLLLLPTTPQQAFGARDAPPPDQADLVALANLMGAPALAFPFAGAGQALGSCQLLAAPGRDDLLLQAATLLDTWPEVALARERVLRAVN